MLIENKLTEHENQSTISSPVHNVIADIFVHKRMQLSLSLPFACLREVLIEQTLFVQHPLNVCEIRGNVI
jgi:hypothetical protein